MSLATTPISPVSSAELLPATALLKRRPCRPPGKQVVEHKADHLDQLDVGHKVDLGVGLNAVVNALVDQVGANALDKARH
ncbi:MULTISPECIES: hypothetical protein [unclassified Bradyrhizobium]|uniref:hypothetical protein n=1 Tax=unclassified Bradyrhizobium TaxID=2631580 RepID=UPI0028EC560D|nr:MULTISPECIES: hypothetical protein [unclassified Bradyrhizobium]